MTSTAKQPKLEYHRGIDYAVIMRPEDTTDTALISIHADTDEEADRFAAKIIAADEMLESLIRVEKHLPGVVKMLEIEAFSGKGIENAKAALKKARAAIAKATGGAA